MWRTLLCNRASIGSMASSLASECIGGSETVPCRTATAAIDMSAAGGRCGRYNVLVNPFVKYAQSYARRRRFTIGLVAVFLLALPVLLYFAWSLYTEAVGQLSITVIGNGKLQPLQSVEINIRRTGRRSDAVGLILDVEAAISRETFIIVSMPETYRETADYGECQARRCLCAWA